MSTLCEVDQHDDGYVECSTTDLDSQEDSFVVSRYSDSDKHDELGCRRGSLSSLYSAYAAIEPSRTAQSVNVDITIQRSPDGFGILGYNEEVNNRMAEDPYEIIPADYYDNDVTQPLLNPNPCREHGDDTSLQNNPKFSRWKKVLFVVIIVVTTLSIAFGIASMYIGKDDKSDMNHLFQQNDSNKTNKPDLSFISTYSSSVQREVSTTDSHATSNYVTSTSSTTEPALQPFDCWEIFQNGVNTSGIYQIYPWGKDEKSKDVLCNMEISPGGWTVIQQRYHLDVSFNRNWSDYKNGFGDLRGDFWLGNEYLHLLTASSAYITTMYLGISNTAGKYWYETFDEVRFAAEDDGYRIYLRGHANGTAGDCSTRHTTVGKVGRMDDQKFSTFDRDNDLRPWQNCATSRGGGWWFNNCQFVFLNGPSGMDGDYVYCGYFDSKMKTFNSSVMMLTRRPLN